MLNKIFYVTCMLFCFYFTQSLQAAPKSIKTKETSAALEEKCVAEINRVRQNYGLKLLQPWEELTLTAREHSQNMADGKVPFSHEGFSQRADRIWKIAPLISFAENVAYSYNYNDPVKIAVDSWMESPGHKENILGDFAETGVGVAVNKKGEYYFTQLFATKQKQNKKSR